MYDSMVFWKGSASRVNEGLKKLTYNMAKYDALKENITIRVKGFGWEWANHAWRKEKRPYTVKELAYWLKIIIAKDKLTSIKKTMTLEPPTTVHRRKENSILGTQWD